MYSKDYLEQIAKDNAFEYDMKWWGKTPRKPKDMAVNGEVVAFYRNHHVFNGVVALWARDHSSSVIFYATPHDVADEKKYGWIPPIFRVEINCDYVYPVPKNKKAYDPEKEEAEGIHDPLPASLSGLHGGYSFQDAQALYQAALGSLPSTPPNVVSHVEAGPQHVDTASADWWAAQAPQAHFNTATGMWEATPQPPPPPAPAQTAHLTWVNDLPPQQFESIEFDDNPDGDDQ